MSSAEGLVLPNQGIPKTLGILNIIFGVILVLFGVCGVGTMLLAPFLTNVFGNLTKQAQQKVEARNKADLKPFDDRIAAEPDVEKKKAIEKEKTDFAANQRTAPKVDIEGATEVLKDPTIMAVTYAGTISGLILHSLLLASGIGLIRMRGWARTLALTWGALIIVQASLLLAANLVYVVPANKPITDKQIANLEEQARGKPPGSPELIALQFTKFLVSLSVPLTVSISLSGMIYPVVLLILLNTPGAKAACLERKSENFGEY